MSTVWLKQGNFLHQTTEGSRVILPKLEDGKIYNICQDPMSGELFLEELSNGFSFGFKIYGIEDKFINYVMQTYANTDRNLGILLDGKKGTGKTICAKMLANRMGLPVILVSKPFGGLQDFISKFSCECIFFFDEFEKTFGDNRAESDGATATLLSVMDGAYNTICRQVFLLTTNKTYIDENFLGRPSRVRYHKTFGNLSAEVVKEVIDDLLEDKSRTNDVIELVDSMALSTIDTLKAIITDINLHPRVDIQTIRDFLNLEFASHRYSVLYRRVEGEEYSLEQFKKEYNLIGTKHLVEVGTKHLVEDDEDDDDEKKNDDSSEKKPKMVEAEYGAYDFNMDYNTVASSRSVEYLQVGDEFWGDCTVAEMLDADGDIVLDRAYGDRMYVHIKGMNKRSIYHGAVYSAYGYDF